MLTCSGCRVARYCSADHQKMASQNVASGCNFLTDRHKVVYSESGTVLRRTAACRRTRCARGPQAAGVPVCVECSRPRTRERLQRSDEYHEKGKPGQKRAGAAMPRKTAATPAAGAAALACGNAACGKALAPPLLQCSKCKAEAWDSYCW